MNLLKSKLSVAIAVGILGGSTQAFACTVTPDSILTEGQTLQLVADCGSVGINTINWWMAVGTDPELVSITEVVTLAQPADKPKKVYLTTPIGLTSAGTGEYAFSVTGTYTGGGNIATAEAAKVIVKPASVAVALALGTNSVTPVNASCGTADGGVVASMPTGTAQCTSGKGALAISGPSYFTWSCLSQTGGAEDNCYATREGGYVAPVEQTAATVNGVCGTAINSSFSSAPTASLCSTPYGNTAVATGSTYTWTCNGSNAALTSDDTSCSAPIATVSNPLPSSSSGDLGIGSGLWLPPTMPNRTVADQSSASMASSYVPGCLNGAFAKDSSSDCALNDSYQNAGVVRLGSGKELVLRYKTPSTLTNGKTIKVSAWNGGSVGVNMRIWLSTDPLATYGSVSEYCKATGTVTPIIATGAEASVTTSKTVFGKTTYTTSNYCKLEANTVYYFGIGYDEAVSTRFQVDESIADFLP